MARLFEEPVGRVSRITPRILLPGRRIDPNQTRKNHPVTIAEVPDIPSIVVISNSK